MCIEFGLIFELRRSPFPIPAFISLFVRTTYSSSRSRAVCCTGRYRSLVNGRRGGVLAMQFINFYVADCTSALRQLLHLAPPTATETDASELLVVLYGEGLYLILQPSPAHSGVRFLGLISRPQARIQEERVLSAQMLRLLTEKEEELGSLLAWGFSTACPWSWSHSGAIVPKKENYQQHHLTLSGVVP